METWDLADLALSITFLLLSLMAFSKPKRVTDLVSHAIWNKKQREQWKELMESKVSARRYSFLLASAYWLFRIFQIISASLSV